MVQVKGHVIGPAKVAGQHDTVQPGKVAVLDARMRSPVGEVQRTVTEENSGRHSYTKQLWLIINSTIHLEKVYKLRFF